LAEECAEVIQAVTKIQRHGLHSRHPGSGQSNQTDLSKELGQVAAIVRLAREAKILDDVVLHGAELQKLNSIGRYLHHATVSEDVKRSAGLRLDQVLDDQTQEG
jgi:hypothetical protein